MFSMFKRAKSIKINCSDKETLVLFVKIVIWLWLSHFVAERKCDERHEKCSRLAELNSFCSLLFVYFITHCLNFDVMRTKVAAPLSRHVKWHCFASAELRVHCSLKQIWQMEWRSWERQADVGTEHCIMSVKNLTWLKWHKLLRGPSHPCVPIQLKFTTGFWSPAIMDCHRSKDDKKGRL